MSRLLPPSHCVWWSISPAITRTPQTLRGTIRLHYRDGAGPQQTRTLWAEEHPLTKGTIFYAPQLITTMLDQWYEIHKVVHDWDVY